MAGFSETTDFEGNRLLNKLDDMRRRDQFCDSNLIAEGERFPVHRVVMTACSDYFDAMFQTRRDDNTETVHELPGSVTRYGLQLIITFAYSGHLGIHLENVEIILSTATHLRVSRVIERCTKFLNESFAINNYKHILDIASTYGLTETRKKILRTHLEDYAFNHEKEFLEMNFEEFAELLEINSLQIQSEIEIFEMVLKWVKHDVTGRRVNLAPLISRVRMPLMTAEQLDKVGQFEEVTSNEECQALLTEARYYQREVARQPLLQSNRTQIRSDQSQIILSLIQGITCLDVRVHSNFDLCPPLPLNCPYVTVVDNFLYVCGGVDESGEVSPGCCRFDPRFDAWSILPAMGVGRANSICTSYNNSIYMIGGATEDGVLLSSVERFSIERNKWEMCPSLPAPVYKHAAAVLGERIYVSGGLNNADGIVETVTSYDPVSELWTGEAPLCKGRRNHHMVTVGQRLVVCGGFAYGAEGPCCETSIEMFCLATGSWTLCRTRLKTYKSGAISADDNIYILGGVTCAEMGDYYFDKVCVYSPENDRFVPEDGAFIIDKNGGMLWSSESPVYGIAKLVFPNYSNLNVAL